VYLFGGTKAWTQGHLPDIFWVGYFYEKVSWTIFPGWLQTSILQITTSWVAKITGRVTSVGYIQCISSKFTTSVVSPQHPFFLPPFKTKFWWVPLCYLHTYVSDMLWSASSSCSLHFPYPSHGGPLTVSLWHSSLIIVDFVKSS
jgi:hypothetical protein